jgi:VanZ family protein
MPLRYYVLTVAYCAGLFWLSSRSGPPQPPFLFAGADKIIHAAFYGGLSTVVAFGLRHSKRNHRPLTLFAAPILFAALYGLSDEIHQYFVPLRSADFYDVLADTIGAILAQCTLFIFIWKIPLRNFVNPESTMPQVDAQKSSKDGDM